MPVLDPENFGLVDPEVEVRLVYRVGTGRGRTERTIRVGATNPAAYKAYLQRMDRPEILLVGAYVKTSLDKSLFNVRTKEVLDLEADAISRIRARGIRLEVDSDVNDVPFAWEVVRDGPVWKVVDPEPVRASSDVMDDILRAITSLRATQFIDAPGDELVEFGLDTSHLTLDLTVGDGEGREEIQLVFGEVDHVNKNLFVRRTGLPAPYYKVVKGSFDRIARSAAELRDTRALDFDRDEVVAIEVTGPGSVLRVVRGEDGGWAVEGEPEAPVDATNVNQLLINLAGLEILELLTGEAEPLAHEVGLAYPESEVRILGADGVALGTLAIGAVAPPAEAGGGFRRPLRPGPRLRRDAPGGRSLPRGRAPDTGGPRSRGAGPGGSPEE